MGHHKQVTPIFSQQITPGLLSIFGKPQLFDMTMALTTRKRFIHIIRISNSACSSWPIANVPCSAGSRIKRYQNEIHWRLTLVGNESSMRMIVYECVLHGRARTSENKAFHLEVSHRSRSMNSATVLLFMDRFSNQPNWRPRKMMMFIQEDH